MNIPFFEEPYIHKNATVMGMVSFGHSCSIWPGVVIRADLNKIQIGNAVNIQDNSTLHSDYKSPLLIGDYSLIGHNVMLHGCSIGRACLIGIGSIILDGAIIGDGAQVMSGCMIRGGKKIPPMSMVIPDGDSIKVIENKSRLVATIAGSLEYIILAERAKTNTFTMMTEEDAIFLNQEASKIRKELSL